MENFILGVLSSVVASLVVWLVSSFIRKMNPNRFRIRYAKYGVPGQLQEVTPILRKKVKKGHLSELVDANLFKGSDPAPGKVKQLTVYYLIEFFDLFATSLASSSKLVFSS